MLLSNYSVINRNTTRDIGQSFTNPFNVRKAPHFAHFYTGEHVITGETDKSAWPNGYNTHYAYHLAPKSGGLSSGLSLLGLGSCTISMAGGVNGLAALSGIGSFSGTLELIVSLSAALSGSGTISSATVQGFLQLAAALSGSGGLSAQLNALGNLTSALSGLGAVSATIRALGTLAADITVTGATLSTSNVADAILDASDGVETNLTLRQALRLIAAALAGKVSGAETTTISFKNAVADDVSRIIATVDSNGNRTAITYDVD